MKSKVSQISIKPFHYKPLNFSIVSSEKHMCPVFFRVVFSCFLNNIFYSEGRGKETRGILLRCHFCFCFSLVKTVFDCFEKQIFYSIFKFYISILTWRKIVLELKVSIYLFFVMVSDLLFYLSPCSPSVSYYLLKNVEIIKLLKCFGNLEYFVQSGDEPQWRQ